MVSVPLMAVSPILFSAFNIDKRHLPGFVMEAFGFTINGLFGTGNMIGKRYQNRVFSNIICAFAQLLIRSFLESFLYYTQPDHPPVDWLSGCAGMISAFIVSAWQLYAGWQKTSLGIKNHEPFALNIMLLKKFDKI